LENYIALANELIQANPHIRLVITGSGNERFLGKKFTKQVSRTINLMGITSLQGLAALMNHLQIFITQDTGALHVASATEIPLVGLFGPTQTEITGPYPLQLRHAIIKKSTIEEITPREVCALTLKKIEIIGNR
jgi:heptosyltransferase-2